MTKFNEFMEALRASENARELFGGASKPQTEEEIVAGYVKAATALGMDLTADDIVEGVKAMEQERRAKTSQAEDEVRELSVEELDAVAGGGDSDFAPAIRASHDNCSSTFLDEENCWFNDGCDHGPNWYDDYVCRVNNSGKDFGGCDILYY